VTAAAAVKQGRPVSAKSRKANRKQGKGGSNAGEELLYGKDLASRQGEGEKEEEAKRPQGPALQEEAEAAGVPETKEADAKTGAGLTRPFLSEWRRLAVSPLQGCTAQMITCLSCSAPSLTQVNPFTALYLTPTSVSGLVAPGTTLEDCLAEFASPDIIRDRICPGCSHQATLEALEVLQAEEQEEERVKEMGTQGKGAEANTSGTVNEGEQQEQQHAGSMRQLHSQLKACKGRIDDCYCQQSTAAAGLPWVKAARPASKCTKVAKLPQVLCLHLRRADMLMTGQTVKVTGHVRFPLVLDMRAFCSTSLVGSYPATSSGYAALPFSHFLGAGGLSMQLPGEGCGAPQGTAAQPSPGRCRYRLQSVVQHHGNPSSGHYTTFRWCCAPGSTKGCWKLVSDTTVREVSVDAVLGSEATLLMYERI